MKEKVCKILVIIIIILFTTVVTLDIMTTWLYSPTNVLEMMEFIIYTLCNIVLNCFLIYEIIDIIRDLWK